jgi:Zn-dependent protease with chaperone function
MTWNQEKFDALIQRLETFARQHPAKYRLRVAVLAALGYAYIFLILAGLLALLTGLVLLMFYARTVNSSLVQIAIFLVILAFIILRSLWVSFPPPTGLTLTRQQVPHLFALVDELTTKLLTPKFHHILLTHEFNAGVAQRPRLGLLGWQRNYLLIGLPLMLALSPQQFSAVLAHEFGHLSGNHNSFHGWIYRLRQTWVQIYQKLQRSGDQTSWALFEWFFNWYTPFFHAYSFVLARINEYEADKCAAEVTGAQAAAEALINTEIKVRFLDNYFWPGIYKQVEQLVEPPMLSYTNMSAVLRTAVNPDDACRWLEQALAEKTNHEDTHPCLTDRLKALGYFPLPDNSLLLGTPIQVSAAKEFLGSELNNLTNYFDRTWKEQVATPWRQRYAYVQESLAKLKALDNKAASQTLSLEEAWQRAYWTWEFQGDEAAIPLLREILASTPNHVAANFTLGQILLQQNDATGIEHIERAIAHNPDLFLEGYELIYLFWKKQGNLEAAQAYQERARKHYDLLMQANG